MANSPYLAPMGAFPETEAQRLYRYNLHVQWEQDEAARIKRDYLKAHGIAKWNEYQARLVRDAEARATLQAQRADEKRIQDTKDILLNKVLERISVSPLLDPLDRGSYTYEVQAAQNLREGRDPASLRQLAADLLRRTIAEQEYNGSAAQRAARAAFGGREEEKQKNITIQMGKKLGPGSNIVTLFNIYSGWIAKLKQLETQYPAVLNADAVARAALASEDPSYKMDYRAGTIIKTDVLATSAAVSTAIGGGLPGMANGGLGTLNAAQLADLRATLDKEGKKKAEIAAKLKDKSDQEKKAAKNLAYAVEQQQQGATGSNGRTPVAFVPSKPPVPKPPLDKIPPKTPVTKTPVPGKGPSAFTGKPPAGSKSNGKNK